MIKGGLVSEKENSKKENVYWLMRCILKKIL